MSGAAAVAKTLAKPQLRGHSKDYITKHLCIAAFLSVLGGFAWKYGVAEPRKKRYAEFYRTYDAEAEAIRMDRLGLFRYFKEKEPEED